MDVWVDELYGVVQVELGYVGKIFYEVYQGEDRDEVFCFVFVGNIFGIYYQDNGIIKYFKC